MSTVEERNHDHTAFVGDLHEDVDELLLTELMVQVGPVVSVYMPRDRVTREHSGFGFVEFRSESDVEYACKIMNGISLFNSPIRVNRSGRDRKILDIGANLFVGNLDTDVDERYLSDTFSHFGGLLVPVKVMRDETSGISKGFAFINYDSFEAADAAIAAMDGQFFGGKRIHVTYAFKKDKPGERHGDAAERLLAANNPIIKHRKELQAATTKVLPSSTPPPMSAPIHPPTSHYPAPSAPYAAPMIPQPFPAVPTYAYPSPIPYGAPPMAMPPHQPPYQYAGYPHR